jgi:hypothetical protein
MPQPLRKWDPRVHFDAACLEQRPKLAAKIAQIAAASTNLDVHIGFLLADIAGSKADVGITMYLALSGSAAQESVFIAVAEKYVPPKLMERLADIMKKQVRARARERNAIIHATWSLHPDDQDALINCPPQSAILHMGEMISHFKTHKNLDTFEGGLENLMIYKAKDFDDVLTRIGETRKAIDAFRTDFETFQTELRQQLLSLANALSKMPKPAHPDKPQSAPPESSEPDQ